MRPSQAGEEGLPVVFRHISDSIDLLGWQELLGLLLLDWSCQWTPEETKRHFPGLGGRSVLPPIVTVRLLLLGISMLCYFP